MMNSLAILYKKELLDASRDKRSVMAGLYYAIGAPIIMCLLFTVLLRQVASPDALYITIENGEVAPTLVQFLESQEIVHGDNPDVKPITLRFSSEFPEQLVAGEPATLYLIADKSDDKLRRSIARVEIALQRFSSEVASLRLLARGVNPEIMRALDVQVQDQATPDSKGGMMLGIATLSIVLTLFYAAMNLAIDTSAGERERQSLSLLLCHPLPTYSIVLAKSLCVLTFSMLGLIIILVVSKFSYAYVPWEQLGFSVNLSVPFMLFCIVVALPIGLMSASLQIFVSFMAKSFKEAQTYVTMVLFIPMALSMVTTYDIATEYVQWLPIAAQQYAMIEFIKGNPIPMPQLLLSSAITLLMFALFSGLSSRLLRSEKVVFGL